MGKLRKQPIAPYNHWNHSLEAGDRVYDLVDKRLAYMHDLVVSRGRNKRDAGELTLRIVKKDGEPRLAYLANDGDWYWRAAQPKGESDE